jgi:uncharacterized repeat protein (TIGR03803 family)
MTKPLRSWISPHSISWIDLLATSIVLVLAVLATAFAQAQTYTKTTLHDFTGGTDGQNPGSRLIMDQAGNLYGTTSSGGVFNNGTIFKVDASGHETVLHTFAEPPYGATPFGRLTMDRAGNLYGTTYLGGAFDYGTVFKLDTSGVYTVLWNFNGGQYGAYPFSGLLYVESEGNFFGTTSVGGNRKCANNSTGCGVVFKLAPNSSGGWTETVLHTFKGPPDGEDPQTELVRDAQGFLYGTTAQGGTAGVGTVYKVRGRQESVLYSFAGGADGVSPSALLLDPSGNLLGTTFQGGKNACRGGCGTVFKVDKNGSKSVIYFFTGGTNGRGPGGRLLRDAAGNLYGVTFWGGEKIYNGAVYKLDTTGKETVLYGFLGGADGRVPDGLARDAAGNLYGTTSQGGLNDCQLGSSCGTVFKLTPQ